MYHILTLIQPIYKYAKSVINPFIIPACSYFIFIKYLGDSHRLLSLFLTIYKIQGQIYGQAV